MTRKASQSTLRDSSSRGKILLFLGQRDELQFVARHLAEMAGLPVGLRLLDPVLPRRHEIPPEVPWPVHRRAAEDDEMRVGRGRHRGGVAGLEHEELAGLEAVA